MAKSLLRLEARKLRHQGLSMKNIAKNLGVSRSSVSWWTRDIILSEEQILAINLSAAKGRKLGRVKGSQVLKLKRQNEVNAILASATRSFILNENELLQIGLALYWAEGGKSLRDKRVEFCNSDPRMIKLLLLWLDTCFKIPKEDLRCVVGINQIHSPREEIVKAYWSGITGIPLSQFRKTSFKKVVNSKVYDNFDQHYGTLSVLVAKSTDLYYQIIGLIESLSQSKVRQGSLAG